MPAKTFHFDPSVYRLTAVKKAGYRFSAAYAVQIEHNFPGPIIVTLTTILVQGTAPALDDFPREVLDQELREVVSEETSAVRDVLLAQAFSELNLVDDTGEDADHLADPLGIDASSLSGKHG